MKSSEVRAGRMSAFIRVANHILESVSTYLLLQHTSTDIM
jgi:hypothetical protein